MSADNTISSCSAALSRYVESILREKLNSNLVVEKCVTSNLVKPGKNYGSTLLKVDLSVRREKNSHESENLHLVAKMLPRTETQRVLFDSFCMFPKEIFMFEKLIPAYQNLELEHGVAEDKIFNGVPEFYGCRVPTVQKTGSDMDYVILMKNLKVQGYRTNEQGVDFNIAQAKRIVDELAHFHALGMGLKFKKPKFFDEVRSRAKCVDFVKESTDQVIKYLFNLIEKNEKTLPYKEKITSYLPKELDTWLAAPAEPWGTIVHADLWLNNIMIRDDGSGDSIDVKLIDFQNYLYMSPLRDLILFIFICCDRATRTIHFGEVIDHYYERFVNYLKVLDCDTSLFPRDAYDEQLCAAAHLELFHSLIMVRIQAVEVKNEDIDKLIAFVSQDPSSVCDERIVEQIGIYVENNWL